MGQYTDDSINFYENYDPFDIESKSNNHPHDPNYYFTTVKIDEILRETEKAYQFKNGKYSFWIPKSLCRELKTSSVLIWDDFKYTFVEIVTADDINNMFDVIEDDEPDFTEIIKQGNFPTPFD
jgi:hypothetical protein